MKTMDSARGLGAKHSHALWHGEHLQRRRRAEGAFSCFEICVSEY
jgi:hypothetical protein